MLGWTLNMLASARKTWLRWTLQMLASTCKKVSWYVIALRLALAGCAAQSPTSRIRTLRWIRSALIEQSPHACWTLHMLASANKTAKSVSWYSIALRLTHAGCAAHWATATRHSLHFEDCSQDSTACSCWQGLLSIWVSFLRPMQICPEPGSNLITTTVTMLNKILFGLLKFYFTSNTGRKTTSYTFLQLSIWYHFVAVTCQATFLVPKTVVISHPTGPLQYFTSHYFALQKKLYSRAF